MASGAVPRRAVSQTGITLRVSPPAEQPDPDLGRSAADDHIDPCGAAIQRGHDRKPQDDLGLFGDATLVSRGLFGEALGLDGVQGTYAQALTNNTQFDFSGSDFTVQVWAKFNDITNGREETLIEKFSGAAGPGWSLT